MSYSCTASHNILLYNGEENKKRLGFEAIEMLMGM